MTLMGFTISPVILWLAAAIVLALLEALTTGITCIWFAAGAIVATILAGIGAPPAVQIVAFLVVSIVLLITTRPIVKKKFNNRMEKTNVDAVIGMNGIAITDVDSISGGRVKADGKEWAAITDGETIISGSQVVIDEINGVTLKVREK